MVSHWSDSKSPQVSRTLLSILVDLHNSVVWMLSTCPLISKSSCPFTNPLGIVPRAPFGIIVTLMFHIFCSLARFRYLSYFSLSFIFTLRSAGATNSPIRQVLFFVNYHYVWSPRRDLVIRLYLKILEKFVHLIWILVCASTTCSFLSFLALFSCRFRNV